MELYLKNLHFLNNNYQYDVCVHGNIYFKVDDEVVSDGFEIWNVSTAVYRFLKALKVKHTCGGDQMIPCCGHFMIPHDDNAHVDITSCPNGIDFDVELIEDKVKIFTDEIVHYVSLDEYKEKLKVVINDIEYFYYKNKYRKFETDFEKLGFSAFITEWFMLKKEFNIETDVDEIYELQGASLATTDMGIIGINKYGIAYNNFRFVPFYQRNGYVGSFYISDKINIITIMSEKIDLPIVFPKDEKDSKKNKEIEKKYNDIKSKIESFGYVLGELKYH